jgi:D-sedoheptulose 7-phosphate isomerase
VEFDGAEILAYNKTARTPQMRHIDYGFSVFRAEVFTGLPVDAPTDLATVTEDLAHRGLLAGYEVHHRFYEIGSLSGLAELEAHFRGNRPMSYAQQHLAETIEVVHRLDPALIERMAEELAALRARGGRLFFLGVGGSAGNCSHAVNDFRKIVGIEAYAPTDNVSELTARTNDEGWHTIFREWLATSQLDRDDAVFVFSVGGGNFEKNISPNLVGALQLAKEVGARIFGVVGRDGGYTAQVGDVVCIIPTVNPDNVTPHSEAFQAVVWHLLVSHPALKARQTKWESTTP